MAWDFKLYQDGWGFNDLRLQTLVLRWGMVHNLAEMCSLLAETIDPESGTKPQNMRAAVHDEYGNEIVSLGGGNSWRVPSEPPEHKPEPESRPRLRM